jgi:tyrosyl-tRNA synthetase
VLSAAGGAQGGGARLNDEKVSDIAAALTLDMLEQGKVKLSMGKKKHGLVVLK